MIIKSSSIRIFIFSLVMKTYLIIAVSLFCFMCTCKSPTNNNDDPPSNDTIPSSMHQEHIPWPSLADSPWPMYRHDPQGTGRSQYPGPQLGQIKWQLPAPGVSSGNGFTSTAIGPDGTLYIPSSYEKHEGIGQVWNFYAIDPFGNIKWTWFDSLHIHNEIESVPLVTNNNTIILCAMHGGSGHIHALNPDGTLKWQYPTKGQPSNPNIGLDGTIYFTTSKGLYALTPDGQLKWELNKDNDFGPSASGGVAISPDGQTLYLGGTSGYDKLYAISSEGELEWSFNDGDTTKYYSLNHIPIVDNQNNIYINTPNGLFSISPEGEKRWKYNRIFSGEHFVMGANGHIYIYNVSKITALDYSGQELWSVDHGYVQPGFVMDVNGIIYTIENTGPSAVSNLDGSIIWKLNLDANYPSWYTPALGNGMLYMGVAGGEGNKFLYAIE